MMATQDTFVHLINVHLRFPGHQTSRIESSESSFSPVLSLFIFTLQVKETCLLNIFTDLLISSFRYSLISWVVVEFRLKLTWIIKDLWLF